MLYLPSPDVRADQIGELPVGPLLQHDDPFPLLCHHRGVNRARGAGANHNDIDFFVFPDLYGDERRFQVEVTALGKAATDAL